jgi:hypothetical protein
MEVKMKVKALKTFYHDKLGKVRPGEFAEITPQQAKMFLEMGAVEIYETKVVHQAPAVHNIEQDQPQRPKRGRPAKTQ